MTTSANVHRHLSSSSSYSSRRRCHSTSNIIVPFIAAIIICIVESNCSPAQAAFTSDNKHRMHRAVTRLSSSSAAAGVGRRIPVAFLFPDRHPDCFCNQHFQRKISNLPKISRSQLPPIFSPFAKHNKKRSSSIMSSSSNQYIDAGANLLDSMYSGTYHDKPRHDPDLDIVLQRAYNNGVHSIISLAGTLEESKVLLDLCENGIAKDTLGEEEQCVNDVTGDGKSFSDAVKVFGTVGIHPTRCAEIFAVKSQSKGDGEEETASSPTWTLKAESERQEITQQLIDLAKRGKQSGNVIAIGEFGLDYARLHFCPKEIQHVGLRAQLEVACETSLPLYLHNRESGDDLMAVLSEYRDMLVKCQHRDGGNVTDNDSIRGIVHSFDESLEIANQFLSLGLYIGINGCSLKTPQNLEVVKELPLNKLILETDCPWCDIRPTHAGFSYIQTTFPCKKEKQYTPQLGKEGFCVKNRTEPCHVAQVAEVVAGLKGVDVKDVVEICCGKNVYDLFGNLKKSKE